MGSKLYLHLGGYRSEVQSKLEPVFFSACRHPVIWVQTPLVICGFCFNWPSSVAEKQIAFAGVSFLSLWRPCWGSNSAYEKAGHYLKKKGCSPIFPYIIFNILISNPFHFAGLIWLGIRDGVLYMKVPHTDRPSDQDKFPNLRIILMGWERAAQFCHLRRHPPTCTTALIVEESCAHQQGHYCRQSSCRSLVPPSHAYTAGSF